MTFGAIFQPIRGIDVIIRCAVKHFGRINCLPSTINISFHGVDAEGIFLAVKEDYAFSNGSACNSGSHAPSYVLTAMGLDESRVSEAVRISWNHDTKVDFSALTNYVKSMTE